MTKPNADRGRDVDVDRSDIDIEREVYLAELSEHGDTAEELLSGGVSFDDLEDSDMFYYRDPEEERLYRESTEKCFQAIGYGTRPIVLCDDDSDQPPF